MSRKGRYTLLRKTHIQKNMMYAYDLISSTISMLPKPIQSPRIPIWTAGGWPNRKPFRRGAHYDGIYLMAVNQSTGNLPTPEEIREIVAYVNTYRESTDPFDIAVSGETPGDPGKRAEIVRPYSEAGATWWVEFEASRGSFEEYRERIRQGPPRMEEEYSKNRKLE